MQKKIKQLFSLLLPAMATLSVNAQTSNELLDRKEVKSFISQMVTEHQFDEKQLNAWLSQTTLQPNILKTIAKPSEKLPWHRYETLLVTPARVQDGVAFWRMNADSLAKAQAKYGVPPEIIVAIIGVETSYGKNVGSYKILDSLATLGFDYPPRSQFFLSELKEFLLLAREEKWDPTAIKGSYAGAMGTPQFIASSYRRYAVDFNENGNRDLLNSIDDAIGSVANYFKIHGWQTKGPVVISAKTSGEKFKPLIASKANPKPEYSLAQLSQSGVGINAYGISPQKLDGQHFAFIALEGKEGPQYWLGAQNFYVITRYNHSDHYAMAVYNLSQQVKNAYSKST